MKEQICCFGGLKVIDAEQNDVSKKFSPKIKQLFVLILLHSIGGQKGISSKKLSDCLWPGMNTQKAKNIRGTNIQNLKALLASCSGIKLVFQDKLWSFEIADQYFIDYAFVEAWLNMPDLNNVDQLASQLPELLSILKKGTMFPNMSESWVDPYIDRMSNRIIEFGLNMFRLLPEEKCDALLLEVAEVISINDLLNEPALRKKISILTRQGKLSLAHSVFDNFGKLYFELYQEKYSVDFKSLITNDVDGADL
jgi:two-component SAPR family response regulator